MHFMVFFFYIPFFFCNFACFLAVKLLVWLDELVVLAELEIKR